MGENFCPAVPLLEYLAGRCHCVYLSDLRFLNEAQRRRLACEIEAVSADAASLREWNDALEYLTGRSAEQTVERARKRLIQSLFCPRARKQTTNEKEI